MRIVFLDIDGVLNYRPGHQLDTLPVANFNQLVKDLGAQVVVHSSWTYLYDLDTIKRLLFAGGVDVEPLIDSAPVPPLRRRMSGVYLLDNTMAEWAEEMGVELVKDEDAMDLERAIRIMKWLQGHPEVTEYVILDDYKRFGPLSSRHVLTTLALGKALTAEKASEAMEVCLAS